MSVKKIFPLDPYNIEHLKIIEEIINNSDFETYFCNELLSIRNNFSKEEYLTTKKKANEIEEILLIEDNSKLIDYCYIRGEKDLKLCQIAFPKVGINYKGSISLVTMYAQNDLNFEEIFIKLNVNDKNNSKKLQELGFEFIGEEAGNIIFLKEKDQKLSIQRKI